jgi:hypothetical protein
LKLINLTPTIGRTFFAAALLAASCAAQQQPGTEKRQAGGERIVTGCLQRSGSSFVLNTNQGSYELNTDRDLSAFVGKQVKISGRWESTGTITTAPVGNAPSQAPASPSGETAGPNPAFVGDLHLHITGTVVGDCGPPK